MFSWPIYILIHLIIVESNKHQELSFNLNNKIKCEIDQIDYI